MEGLEKNHHIFPIAEWKLDELEHQGLILDIGGGGEGVIGKLHGNDVVAIDLNKEELEEAADGPLKIVMDARELQFLDESFQTATAFFALMYLKEKEDQTKVFQEVARVLKPGGIFHVWEIDLAQKPKTDKESYIVHLQYEVGLDIKETGYGMRWPNEPRGINDYLAMAKSVGFTEYTSRRVKDTFYLGLIKANA